MKKLYYKIMMLLFIAVITASCKRTLETEPLEQFTEDYVWDELDSAGVNAGQYLNGLYSKLPKGFNRVGSIVPSGASFLDAATDDAVPSTTSITAAQMIATGGGITPFVDREFGDSFGVTNPMWKQAYAAIRIANNFINNIDRVPLAGTIDGTRSTRSAWKAEARFIRAFFYFELIKRYGGVPLVGDKVFTIQDDPLLPRNTFEECVNYIVKECDLAKDSLRYDPVLNADFGRVTRGAALALKARTLLYAASPLFNGGNTGKTGPEKLVAGYSNFDNERWRLAADAARAIVELDAFSLNPDFINLFLIPRDNREIIFALTLGSTKELETQNGPIGFQEGNSANSPTQELVESFPMKNGLPITDPASNYNYLNQYANRDPRLKYTVLYNGAPWLNSTIETFEGGRNKPNGNRVQTRTGYYARKFLGKAETQANYAAGFRPFIYFRYAEVYLNFAEAVNEISGPETKYGSYSPVEAIIGLRQRAGIDAGNGRYGIPEGINKEEMRNLIRNERRIELAFEEHRFWDIRRWKIAENLNNKPLHGVSIIGKPGVVESITPVEIYDFVFDANKMYLHPIPQSELDKNRNLIQNPGW